MDDPSPATTPQSCPVTVGPLPDGHTHGCTRTPHDPLDSAVHTCQCGAEWVDTASMAKIQERMFGATA